MTDTLRVAVVQLNFTVGDIPGNATRIIAAAEQARVLHGCDLAVFPELALTGYPPEDLLLRPAFLAQADDGLEHIARS
ncbi:MAG: NAD+ synthase, partial [Gammaproteobacteria bacterium]|nr:NAD+ synthase [Gammaproteobacteria bacterium]